MSVIQITTKAQFDELVSKTPHALIQATASWCGPCKAITPLFNKHAESLSVPDAYAFARFDTDDVPDLAQELGIRSIPAFFAFENGEKVDNLAGANPPALQKLAAGIAEKAKSGGGAVSA